MTRRHIRADSNPNIQLSENNVFHCRNKLQKSTTVLLHNILYIIE